MFSGTKMFDVKPASIENSPGAQADDEEHPAKKTKEELATLSPPWSVLSISGANTKNLPEDPIGLKGAFDQAALMSKKAITIPSLESMLGEPVAAAIGNALALTDNDANKYPGGDGGQDQQC